MRTSILAGLLAAGFAHAFSDSSPFLLFSTAEFHNELAPAQLQTSSRVIATAKNILSECPTTQYLLVSQANVHASDLDGPEGCGVHRIRSAVTGTDVNGRYTVAEVIPVTSGNMSMEDFSSYIRESCTAKLAKEASVRELTLPPLPAYQDCKSRAEAMDDNDYVLGNILQEELSAGDYTVLFFSTPLESKQYSADFQNPAQIHIKKRIAEPARVIRSQAAGGASDWDNAALFEKYQFFTPGVFMGLFALLIILSILYVGLSAVSSLQIPYGAFDKEMGPATQKKQG